VQSNARRPRKNAVAALPPGVAGAAEYLRAGIVKGAWSETGRLPSIKTLARAADVSLVTMWKALRALREAGEVEVLHGKGVRVAGPHGQREAPRFPTPRPAEQQARWHTVRQRIESDILNGRFGADMILPTRKELGHAYGASSHVLTQALKALETDGVLLPHGRTYSVRAVTTRRSDAYVVVVGRGQSSGEASSWTPWSQEWQRILERECATAEVGLESYLYADRDGRLVFLDQDTGAETALSPRASCLGVLVRSIGQDDLHLQVLHQIVNERNYVAMSDEGTCEPLPAPFSRNRRMAVFAVSNGVLAGRKVARFLLAHRHRRAAYISPFNNMRWSRDRLLGMQEVYTAAGEAQGVQGFTLDDVAFPFGLRPGRHPSATQINKWLTTWYASVGQKAPRRTPADHLAASFLQAAEDEALRERLEPLFEQAAGDSAFSVWVCVNDRVAVAAQEFLRKNRLLERIAVAGFDDTFEAFRHRFSSYSFNIPALVHAMFTFVVAPHMRESLRSSSRVVNIEGFMVGRGGLSPR